MTALINDIKKIILVTNLMKFCNKFYKIKMLCLEN